MIILLLRTDKPEAELGLYEDSRQLTYYTWQAHRQLAETIHQTISSVLAGAGRQLKDVEGIVIYKGPGSFTGLRIGASVANVLADSIHIPIVGATGENWQAEGVQYLLAGNNERFVSPAYGSQPHITKPKH